MRTFAKAGHLRRSRLEQEEEDEEAGDALQLWLHPPPIMSCKSDLSINQSLLRLHADLDSAQCYLLGSFG